MAQVLLPSYFAYIQSAELFFGILLLALGIYPAASVDKDFGTIPGAIAFGMIFAPIWSILSTLYVLVSKSKVPYAYSLNLHLGLEFSNVAFWITGWAWLAALSTVGLVGDEDAEVLVLVGCILGVLQWLLFVSTFMFVAKVVLAGRKGPAGDAEGAAGGAVGVAYLSQEGDKFPTAQH